MLGLMHRVNLDLLASEGYSNFLVKRAESAEEGGP